jgi:peptide/nickel transport system permease protein
LALFAPVLALYDPLEMHTPDRFTLPSIAYPLGTDKFGCDILSRILVGTRVAFSVGFVSIGLATVVGVVAGYVGRWFDPVSMCFFDALLAFPAWRSPCW